MKFEHMTPEAREVGKSMIDYCINHGVRMGMAEGFKNDGTKERFRSELEEFASCGDTKEIKDESKEGLIDFPESVLMKVEDSTAHTNTHLEDIQVLVQTVSILCRHIPPKDQKAALTEVSGHIQRFLTEYGFIDKNEA